MRASSLHAAENRQGSQRLFAHGAPLYLHSICSAINVSALALLALRAPVFGSGRAGHGGWPDGGRGGGTRGPGAAPRAGRGGAGAYQLPCWNGGRSIRPVPRVAADRADSLAWMCLHFCACMLRCRQGCYAAMHSSLLPAIVGSPPTSPFLASPFHSPRLALPLHLRVTWPPVRCGSVRCCAVLAPHLRPEPWALNPAPAGAACCRGDCCGLAPGALAASTQVGGRRPRHGMLHCVHVTACAPACGGEEEGVHGGGSRPRRLG